MGFYFYAWMWFCSYSYGAPLEDPSGRWSSAIENVGKQSQKYSKQSQNTQVLCKQPSLARVKGS